MVGLIHNLKKMQYYVSSIPTPDTYTLTYNDIFTDYGDIAEMRHCSDVLKDGPNIFVYDIVKRKRFPNFMEVGEGHCYATLSNDATYVWLGYNDGHVAMFSSSTGHQFWKLRLSEHPITNFHAFKGTTLIVGDANKFIYVVDAVP